MLEPNRSFWTYLTKARIWQFYGHDYPIRFDDPEKATCFRRVTDSTESLNDPAPAVGSSPWRPASLPYTFFDDTHYKLTDRWFRQITPMGIRNTRSLGTNDIPKAPRLAHAFGALGPMPKAAPQLFNRAAEVALGVSFNDQSQTSDIPGTSWPLHFRDTQIPYRSNPRTRIYTRCAHLRKSFWPPSTPKLKLPTIRLTSRLPSVIHVICSHHHPLSVKWSQGCLPFSFRSYLKAMLIYSRFRHKENAPSGILTLLGSCAVFTDSICSKSWLVSMVVDLVVPSLFRCVISTIHTVPHYIAFCMYHLPKRHMVCDHLKALLAYCAT